ncbi:hypothetical protein V6N13_148757 [Hibiscus sabdariffa]
MEVQLVDQIVKLKEVQLKLMEVQLVDQFVKLNEVQLYRVAAVGPVCEADGGHLFPSRTISLFINTLSPLFFGSTRWPSLNWREYRFH